MISVRVVVMDEDLQIYTSRSQSGGPEPAASTSWGNTLEMKIPRLYRRPARSETRWGESPESRVCTSLSRVLMHT